MLSIIASLGLSAAAIASVYLSWRNRSGQILWLSGLLFISSCILWSYSQGWEFGVVYALCAPALLIWPFVAKNQVVLPAPKNQPEPRKIPISVKHVARHLGHGVVILVGLLLTSLLVSLAVSVRLPFVDAGQLAIMIVMLPLLWGMLVYHYLATLKKGRAIAGYTLLSVVSALLLIYLPGLK